MAVSGRWLHGAAAVSYTHLVVGLGGIATGRDALEFIMAGAAAVQVGAANFANPRAMETIADEMAAWMDKNGVKTLDEIRGCARNAE